MTCEDYEEDGTWGENHGEGLLAKGAHRLSLLIASRRAGEWTQFLPRELRQAITTVLLAVMNVVNARPPKW